MLSTGRSGTLPKYLAHARAQANVTDNVPLHVLGGNIVPMALGKEFMLTRDVRNASLALVVAFPAENSTMTGEALDFVVAGEVPGILVADGGIARVFSL